MKKTLLFTLLLGLLALSGCTMPDAAANTELTLQAQAGTLVAQTLTAAAEQVPSETPRPANTPTLALPTVTPAPTEELPPTLVPRLPETPSLQKYDFFCSWNGSNTELSITILWNDKATDEEGYKLYRNGEEIADLVANSNSYADLYAVTQGAAVTYGIEAYNQAGASAQIAFSVKCE